jgi:KaiC/GvpD/RAD55 family RecA-like ATPase
LLPSPSGGIHIEVVKTGIGDFDHLFAGGGYPKGNTILVIGGPGSGKSIFGMQYIYKGAKEHGEPGVYVTLDETPEKLRKNISSFGWDIKALEDEGKVVILDAISARVGVESREAHRIQAGLDLDAILSQIVSAIEKVNATRLVIDSLAVMNLYSQSEFSARTNMLRMSNLLSLADLTTLVITEAKTAEVGLTEFPSEAFMFDGVITLRLDAESQERRISIIKMRGTKHVIGTYRFEIAENGISVIP